MVNIDFIDSTKVNEIGNNILENMSLYDEIVENLYNKINNMNTKTLEWVGNGANKYVETFNNDFKMFTDLSDTLKKYAYFLIDSSALIDETIKKDL